jgi:hypothetical protein
MLLFIYGVLIKDKLLCKNSPFEENCFENHGKSIFQQITDYEVKEIFDLVYDVGQEVSKRSEFKMKLPEQEIMAMIKRCNYEKIQNVLNGKLQMKDTILQDEIKKYIMNIKETHTVIRSTNGN